MTDSKTEGSGAIEFIRDCGAAGKHRVQLACVFVGQDCQPTRADRADLAAAGYVPKAELQEAGEQWNELHLELQAAERALGEMREELLGLAKSWNGRATGYRMDAPHLSRVSETFEECADALDALLSPPRPAEAAGELCQVCSAPLLPNRRNVCLTCEQPCVCASGLSPGKAHAKGCPAYRPAEPDDNVYPEAWQQPAQQTPSPETVGKAVAQQINALVTGPTPEPELGKADRCGACNVLLSSLPEKRFANVNLSNRLMFCSHACAESVNSCRIPSRTLGPCESEWGHDGNMHNSAGDGFYARDHEVEHQRRQAVRATLVTLPHPAPPANPKLPGGMGPDYVTRGELVRLLREAAASYLQNTRDAFGVLASALAHEASERGKSET